MRYGRIGLCLLLFSMLLAGCAAPAASVDELLAADRAFAALSAAEGPAAAFAAYLTDDAWQLPGSGEPVRGGQRIAADLAEADGLILAWTPESGGVSADGSLGWTWGYWTATTPGEDGDRVSTGKYINVWVRDEAGAWKVLVDMGNSESE